MIFDPGVGRMLNGNSDIVLQMHYTTNGKATTDKTQVGLRFLKEPPPMQQRGGSVIQPRFVIPAGAPAHEVRGSRVLQADTIITSFTPHMHVRGKDMTYTAKYPDGRTEVLLSVPKYDFNWQITYQLKEAKRMPKGTEIEVVAHFDNSPQNKFNPDPTKDVRWGDQTLEEMMIGFWGTVAERPKQVNDYSSFVSVPGGRFGARQLARRSPFRVHAIHTVDRRGPVAQSPRAIELSRPRARRHLRRRRQSRRLFGRRSHRARVDHRRDQVARTSCRASTPPATSSRASAGSRTSRRSCSDRTSIRCRPAATSTAISARSRRSR